jgi:REP element-mobilizing transposase RayT
MEIPSPNHDHRPEPRKTHPDRLPRLPREYYQGDAVVFWTLTTFDRSAGWLSNDFHHAFRELMLHALAREQLLCPNYCLMPDHIHFIWMGLARESDQLNAISFLRTHLEPKLKPTKLQPQSHDHVLRAEDRLKNAFAKICYYITENPVRASLVNQPETWPYTNVLIPGYPNLNPFAPDHWDKLWKIYYKLKTPTAHQITKPPYDCSRRANEFPL